MRNFEILKEEIENRTHNTSNYRSLRRGPADARGYDNGFYIVNVVTNNCEAQFRNLKEVEKYIEEVIK